MRLNLRIAPLAAMLFAAVVGCSKNTNEPLAAGAPKAILISSGNLQTAVAGSALPKPLTVKVIDSVGTPVPNVDVYFYVAQGTGSLSADVATTNRAGNASVSLTLGTEAGPQAVVAEIYDAQDVSIGAVIFQATALARAREGTSATLGSRPYALAVSHDVVYVGQLDAAQVTRFNGSSTTAAATVAVGNTPTELAFNAAGTKAYVTNQFSDNIGIIDVATNTQTGTIPVTGDPFKVIVSPDGNSLYVTTNANYVYKIDIASKTATGSVATGQTANGLALNSDGSKLYVSTRDGGSVLEVNTATMTTARTFTTGGRTQEVVVGPNNAELYVANEADGKLYIFNLASGAQAGTVANLGNGPWGMALSPDGTKLWISVLWTGNVKVVDRVARTISRSLYTGGTPRRIGFLSNGTAVVANEAGYVTWLQ